MHSHFHEACRYEWQRYLHAPDWGSKWRNCSQMVPIICVLNHEWISWVSIEIYYHDNFVFGHICMFLTSILLTFAFCVHTWSANSEKPLESRTMVCCSNVGICFGFEHNHMPDRVLHSAWRTKDYKIWSQDHGLTWAVTGAHIQRGFEYKVGMYMGIGLWSLSPMNT